MRGSPGAYWRFFVAADEGRSGSGKRGWWQREAVELEEGNGYGRLMWRDKQSE